MRRPPALVRLAGVARLLRVLALVGIVAFVALAGYSASQLRVHGDPSSTAGNGQLVSSALEFHAQVNVSNPGWMAFHAVGSTIVLSDPNGTVLGGGGSLPVDLPAGSTTAIIVHYQVPLAVLQTDSYLVTRDAQLPIQVWVNGTYASLFPFSLTVRSNYSWGAPLFGLQVTPGSPAPGPNGTVLVPIQVTFENHAPFDDVGNVTLRLLDSSGAVCGTTTQPVDAAAGSPYSQSWTVSGQPGCSPASLEGTLTASGWSYSLAPTGLP